MTISTMNASQTFEIQEVPVNTKFPINAAIITVGASIMIVLAEFVLLCAGFFPNIRGKYLRIHVVEIVAWTTPPLLLLLSGPTYSFHENCVRMEAEFLSLKVLFVSILIAEIVKATTNTLLIYWRFIVAISKERKNMWLYGVPVAFTGLMALSGTSQMCLLILGTIEKEKFGNCYKFPPQSTFIIRALFGTFVGSTVLSLILLSVIVKKCKSGRRLVTIITAQTTIPMLIMIFPHIIILAYSFGALQATFWVSRCCDWYMIGCPVHIFTSVILYKCGVAGAPKEKEQRKD